MDLLIQQDLLESTARRELKIKEGKAFGTYVEGLTTI